MATVETTTPLLKEKKPHAHKEHKGKKKKKTATPAHKEHRGGGGGAKKKGEPAAAAAAVEVVATPPSSSAAAAKSGLDALLPDDLLCRVLQLLPVQDRFRLARVSRRWRSLLRHSPSQLLLFADAPAAAWHAVAAQQQQQQQQQQCRMVAVAPACHVDDRTLAALLPRVGGDGIEVLSLRGCRVLTDAALAAICAALPCLRVLDVSATRVGAPHFAAKKADAAASSSAETVPFGTTLPAGLTSLAMSMCDHVGNAAVVSLVARCPKLQSLDLSATRVGDLAVAKIAAGLPELRRLELADCKWLSSGALAAAFASQQQPQPSSLPPIERLVLDGTNVDGDAARATMRALAPTLRELSMARCRNLSDAAFVPAATEPPLCLALRSLVLRATPLGDVAVHGIADGAKELVVLSLAWTSVSDKGVLALSSNMPKLRSLDVSWTRLTTKAISRLTKALPLLRHVALEGCEHITPKLRARLA